MYSDLIVFLRKVYVYFSTEQINRLCSNFEANAFMHCTHGDNWALDQGRHRGVIAKGVRAQVPTEI